MVDTIRSILRLSRGVFVEAFRDFLQAEFTRGYTFVDYRINAGIILNDGGHLCCFDVNEISTVSRSPHQGLVDIARRCADN